ncbi:MAG: MmgE/PrpD family protein [Pseudomonadota bacterium]
MNSVDSLLAFSGAASYEDLSDASREAAKTFLADAIAVGISGSRDPAAHSVRTIVTGWGGGDRACVLGSERRLPAASAAYVNSFQVHCQEFDPLHEGATVHAMAVMTGALLAVAEDRNLSGKALLLGIAVGVEVAVTLGLAAREGLRFFRPATAGALGAAVALARMDEVAPDTARDVLGFTYSQLAGTMQAHVEGSVALPLQIAAAARAAVCSLDLAKGGLQAPHDVLDGAFGYFELYERGGSLEAWLGAMGKPWRITELAHKPFPTGRAAHAVLDALRRLGQTHSFSPGDIERIRATVPPLIKRLVARPAFKGMSVNYARLCLGFLIPSLLRDGRIDAGTFTRERLADAELLSFGSRTEFIEDSSHGTDVLSPQFVSVLLKDGSELGQEVPHTLGSPENPLSRQQRQEKFALCVDGSGVPAAELANALARVDELDSVRELLSLCVPAA